MAEKPSILLDSIVAPFRGVEGFVQSTYGLADYIAGDILPDYDERFLGRSETLPGSLIEGTTQFLTGFIPLVGVAGKAGKLGQVGKALAGTSKKAIAARSAIAGVGADFIAFDEHEERLSNLIQQYPELQNPFTEFLAADDDDTVVEGRLKNVIEGIGLGLAANGLFRAFKAFKAGSKAKTLSQDAGAIDDAMAKSLGDEPLETFVEIKDPEDLVDTGDGITTKPTEPEFTEAPLLGAKRNPVINIDIKGQDWDSLRDERNALEKELGDLEDQMFQYRFYEDGDKTMTNAPADLLDEIAAKQDRLSGIELEMFRQQVSGEDLEWLIQEFNKLAAGTDAENKIRTAILFDGIQKREMGDEFIAKIKDDIGDDPNALEVIESKFKNAKKTLDELAQPKSQPKEPTKALPTEPEAKVETEPEVKPKDEPEEFEISEENMVNRTENDVDDELREMMQDLKQSLKEDKASLLIGKVVRQLKSGDTKGAYDYLSAVTSAIKEHVHSVSGTSDRMDEEQLLKVMEIMPSTVRKRMYGSTALRKDIVATEDAAVRTVAYKHVMEGIKENLVQSVKEYRKLNSSQNRAVVAKDLESLAEFQSLYSALGAMFSKGMRKRKVLLSADAVAKRKKSTNILDEIAAAKAEDQVGIADDYLRGKKDKLIDEAINIIEEGGSTDEVLLKLGILAESTNGGKFAMFLEYYINNLLFGLPSQMANILGNLLTTGLLTFERTAGHLVTGDIAKAKLALSAALDLETFWAVERKWARRAWKEDESFLIPGHRAFQEGDSFNAITPEKLGAQFPKLQAEEGSGLYTALNLIGHAIRLPSRGLNTMDEFFKQVNARREAMYRFGVQAMDKGITDPKELSKYIQENMTKLVTESGELHSPKSIIAEGTRLADANGLKEDEKVKFIQDYFEKNYDPNAGEVAKFAAETAKEATFTNDIGGFGRGITQMVNEVPALSLIIPFIRTPLNIMKFSLKRALPEFNVTKYPALFDSQKRMELEVFSSNPTIAADAKGRIVTTATATGIMLSQMFANTDRISGGGPVDPKRKKALEDTGWRPYSIKIGDTWVSYQRLDPFATIIGVLADIKDARIESNYDVADEQIDMLVSTVISTLSRNVTNKSYLSGVEMFIDAMGDTSGNQARRLVGNIAAGSLPFSGFAKHSQAIVGDREAKEIRSIADRVLNVIPGVGKLDVKRNILGEAQITQGLPVLQAVSPIGYSTEKGDKVFEEIASLNHAFRQPDPSYQGLINLLEYRTESGQTAHDRRLELTGEVKIGGRTLRQALEKLISSRNYQRLDPRSEPGLRSPRVTEINKLLQKYRSKALGQTLREFPELARYHKDFTRAKRNLRQGQNMDQLLQTLNF